MASAKPKHPAPPTTGWPPSRLMQDDCEGLSRWLSTRGDARQLAKQAAEQIKSRRHPGA